MQTIFTKEFMQVNRGCYSKDQMNDRILKGQSEISLDYFLTCDIPIKDKYWFVCKKLATKEQNQKIAIGVAEIVLYIFEEKYPEDKRPREAIQAAKDYLAGTIGIEEVRLKRNAAVYAANAAVYAANAAANAAVYAANAAADAAVYAADAAADAAAYAANAAADAAVYAADAAADAAALQNFIINFCKNETL